MWSFIKWAVGVREKEINSINPNSMSPLPSNKFVNYARDIEVNNDDKEPHKNIYEYKAFERSMKQKKQQKDYSDWYDYFNH
tara:strand:- start:6231 stop:6473 length:243 start_codon:yes stop_codon:yes gene_type:complete